MYPILAVFILAAAVAIEARARDTRRRRAKWEEIRRAIEAGGLVTEDALPPGPMPDWARPKAAETHGCGIPGCPHETFQGRSFTRR